MSFRVFCCILLTSLAYIVSGKPYNFELEYNENERKWKDGDGFQPAGSSIFPKYSDFGSKDLQIDRILARAKAEKDLASDYSFYDPTGLQIRSYDGGKDSGKESVSIYSYDHELRKRDHHHHGHDDGHGAEHEHHGHDHHHHEHVPDHHGHEDDHHRGDHYSHREYYHR